jgi:exodeoxyribonuclease-3
VAILARGVEPVEIRRELPGDPSDDHSRYLEAAVEGVVVVCQVNAEAFSTAARCA